MRSLVADALYERYLGLVMGRVGMTRRRADCFLRLWLYLLLKIAHQQGQPLSVPLTRLTVPPGWVNCSCGEAAAVFYIDSDRGSDRSAGMMLDKLVALGLIQKMFDGNTTQIQVLELPELQATKPTDAIAKIIVDDFDPRCDAIPIANLLATNYNWLSRNTDAVPYRIANILRDWARQYRQGLRVLRRSDNQNPLGFYALYPTQRDSEIKFFEPPSQGLHLSQVTAEDPFKMALPGDQQCRAVFVRSFVIEPAFLGTHRCPFVCDAQQTLQAMQQDFPNLMDMYTLVIHPSYADLAQALGFQKTSADPKLPLQWMYQAVDRFMAIDVAAALAKIQG
ncbi:MAG: hypothetical protein F6K00_22020 [Leptolyngbya sp. SIOISBB]|nr:hypothetical protein [Leptolyngbya sp. SIOISBB]